MSGPTERTETEREAYAGTYLVLDRLLWLAHSNEYSARHEGSYDVAGWWHGVGLWLRHLQRTGQPAPPPAGVGA